MVSQTQAAGSFLPAAVVQKSAINRSGIEVPMDAEAETPVVLVGRVKLSSKRVGARDVGARIDACALQLGVQHVHAHVEVLGDVPLGARADPPGLPVVVAAHRRNSSC